MKNIIPIKLALISLLLITFNEVFGQFILSGEIRPRFEYRYGYKQLPDSNTKAAYQVSQRSRLVFRYEKKESFKTNISLQDVRLWGDEKLKADVPAIGLYEAWGELPVFDSLSAKIGRQELIYDNQLLLSNTNWQQKGLTHDMLLLKYKRNGLSADIGSAFNQLTDTIFGTSYIVKDNYKSLNFIWLTQQINPVKISLVGFLDGFQKRATQNTVYLRKTYGTVVNLNIQGISLFVRGFLQSGKDTAGTDISAYYMNSDLSYSFPKIVKLTTGFEYFSGKDATSTDKKVRAFYALYGTRHTFNGNMDYFTNHPKDTKNAGLVDIYFKAEIKAFKNTSFNADFHYFALQNKYVSGGEVIDKYLGTQEDFSCKITISKEVFVNLGYSFMIGTKSLEIIQSKGDYKRLANWAWVMLTIKPEFLKL